MPTIPAFERAKTAHALDRAATVIGRVFAWLSLIHPSLNRPLRLRTVTKQQSMGERFSLVYASFVDTAVLHKTSSGKRYRKMVVQTD
jgi:hypothetical protein